MLIKVNKNYESLNVKLKGNNWNDRSTQVSSKKSNGMDDFGNEVTHACNGAIENRSQ